MIKQKRPLKEQKLEISQNNIFKIILIRAENSIKNLTEEKQQQFIVKQSDFKIEKKSESQNSNSTPQKTKKQLDDQHSEEKTKVAQQHIYIDWKELNLFIYSYVILIKIILTNIIIQLAEKMSELRDFDIKQLHDNIQSCFQYLDKKIYRAMNIAPISNTIIIEKPNSAIAQEYKELQHHVKQLQIQYDQVCYKYMQLIKKYQNMKITLKLQQEEIEHQCELIKEIKLIHLQQPEVIEIPVYEYLREFTKNNHSQLSNFLQILMHTKKLDISMIELLQNIEKYYRPQNKLLFQDKYVYPKVPLKKIRERILKTLPDQTISQNLIPERSISFQ
ncbi:unnamed protein product [Paramecium sonneborni]|uniref:Uncharacterized protein n=1 Tax=Paramecium sonneborni TaxID=65129 RepID=A0A8S1KMU6_9CILI|nr:unnamed protein product [Paramecium sonneborni]